MSTSADAGLSLHLQGRVLYAAGELDLATAPTLQATIEEVHGRHPGLRIDAAGITFCDSTGIGTLIWAHNTLSRDGRPVLINPSRHLAQLITLTGLDHILLDTGPLGPTHGHIRAWRPFGAAQIERMLG